MSLHQHLQTHAISCTQDELEKLELFVELLMQWNRIHNLTGARSTQALYGYIADSLYPLKHIKPPKRLLDVGTGAGFPGLVLSVMLPDTSVTLCEPLRKRSSFLRYVVQALQLPHVDIASVRVEALQAEAFDLITSRAVGNVKLLLKLTSHMCTDATHYLLYKGEQLSKEIEGVLPQNRYAILRNGKRRYLYMQGVCE